MLDARLGRVAAHGRVDREAPQLQRMIASGRVGGFQAADPLTGPLLFGRPGGGQEEGQQHDTQGLHHCTSIAATSTVWPVW